MQFFLTEITLFPCSFLVISCQIICFTYFETVLIVMHYVAIDSVPLKLKNLYRPSNQVHSHNTRLSSAGNYYLKPSRTNEMRDSITRLGPNLWNSLNNIALEIPRKRLKKSNPQYVSVFSGFMIFTLIRLPLLFRNSHQHHHIMSCKLLIFCYFIKSMLKLHHRHCSCICFVMSTLVLHKPSIPFLLFYMFMLIS